MTSVPPTDEREGKGAPVSFVKGHGTENDFLLLPDLDDALELSDNQVRALCDRQAGLGADGIIRIAPDAAGGYFMDYRNADGSAAEMCGNGARVFARYLVEAGLAPAGRIDFGTRGGRRTAELGPSGDVRIEMGPVTVGAQSSARLGGTMFPGTAVDVGNPHLVCLTDADLLAIDLAALDLTAAPAVDAAVFAHGANVEFVRVLRTDQLRMRVHERGVGETRSCGTGTVAAAAAYLAADGRVSGTVQVGVPGGSVTVDIADGDSVLSGPAVLVGSGTVDPEFLAAHR